MSSKKKTPEPVRVVADQVEEYAKVWDSVIMGVDVEEGWVKVARDVIIGALVELGSLEAVAERAVAKLTPRELFARSPMGLALDIQAGLPVRRRKK